MGDLAGATLLRLGREADASLPSCTLSGVLGDVRHTYGYHRGRCVLPSSDYSVRLPPDKLGPACEAGAVDLSFDAANMKVMTERMRRSALDPNDPRLECVREFYGTLDGSRVFGLIHDSPDGGWRGSTSDSSHLWHLHTSIFRQWIGDYAKVAQVLSVLRGEPWSGAPAPVAVTPVRRHTAAAPPYPGHALRYTGQAPRYDPAALRWQTQMRVRGWTITVDGFYGEKSAGVAKAFQQEKNVRPVDGIVGPVTWPLAWTLPWP